MKKLKKMDELELFITAKSIKIAYLYSVVFLFVWFVVDYFVNKNHESIAFLLLITQNLVLIFSKVYYQRKVNCSNEE